MDMYRVIKTEDNKKSSNTNTISAETNKFHEKDKPLLLTLILQIDRTMCWYDNLSRHYQIVSLPEVLRLKKKSFDYMTRDITRSKEALITLKRHWGLAALEIAAIVRNANSNLDN